MKLISQNLTIHIKDNMLIKQLASPSDHHVFFLAHKLISTN